MVLNIEILIFLINNDNFARRWLCNNSVQNSSICLVVLRTSKNTSFDLQLPLKNYLSVSN